MTDGSTPRRRALQLFGAGLITGLAGCIGGGDDDGSETGNGDDDTAGSVDTVGESVKLAANEVTGAELFGEGIGIDGDTVLVGAPNAKESADRRQGGVSVFDGSGGEWAHQETLYPQGGNEDGINDEFGYSVAVDGQTALVGADVVLSGDTAIVTADNDEDPNGDTGEFYSAAGSAYQPERSGGDWSAVAKLVPGDGDPEDHFGMTATQSGDTAVVGAPLDSGPDGTGNAGSVYLFDT